MDSFIEYIEQSLPDSGGDKILYRYKRQKLDEMTESANRAVAAGLRDRRVINDLVISEYPDLRSDYEQYLKKEKRRKRDRRNFLINAIGSLAYIVLLAAAYLSLSFATGNWSKTWVLMADGVLLAVFYLTMRLSVRMTAENQTYQLAARAFLAIGVMVFSVSVFLLCLSVFRVPNSWVIIICGVAMMFICDGTYAVATKQKFAIVSVLVYIPATASMLYIILCASSVFPWSRAWLMIPLSLLLDFAVVLAALRKNSKQNKEVMEAWNEN
ncbi:MAG: hypothetical protein ACI4JR_03815 [Acutalibacteraceae bacterium]